MVLLGQVADMAIVHVRRTSALLTGLASTWRPPSVAIATPTSLLYSKSFLWNVFEWSAFVFPIDYILDKITEIK